LILLAGVVAAAAFETTDHDLPKESRDEAYFRTLDRMRSVSVPHVFPFPFPFCIRSVSVLFPFRVRSVPVLYPLYVVLLLFC